LIFYVFERLSQKQLRGQIVERLAFSIKGSQGDEYAVVFEVSGNNANAFCTCQAGVSGQYCKHRWLLSGFGVMGVGSSNQRLDQGAEQSLSAFAGIVNELEKPERERQLFLGDAAMRPQPGSQERPEALEGVDVDLAEPIAVLVPGVFASTMTDCLVAVAEARKPGVDALLVSIDIRAFGDGLLDDRMEGRLLNIGQHPDHHLAAALDHAEDWRLFFLQGAATAAPLQPIASASASFGQHRLGMALVSSDDVDLVELDIPAQDHLGCLRHDAVAQHLGHGLDVALAQTEFLCDLTVR
jgi:hypothetical protein